MKNLPCFSLLRSGGLSAWRLNSLGGGDFSLSRDNEGPHATTAKRWASAPEESFLDFTTHRSSAQAQSATLPREAKQT